jgi:gliding-associated putative ABC transporter substrate-binding component GldG
MIAGSVFRAQQGRLDFDPDKANRELEYKIITTIYNMTRERTKVVGLLTGHGEYPKEAMADLFTELDPLYNIISVDLTKGRSLHPKDVDLLLVLQPQTALREREKYELDQYLMRGGRILWCMDQEIVDFSIGEQGSTLTDLRNTNLDDFFMKQGLKVNYDLVQDLNCGFIDAASYTTTFGNALNQKKWVFNPLVYNFSNHPSTRYLNNVLLRLSSSMDTFPTPGVNKTVLMVSSKESRLLSGRQYINVDQALRQPPDPKKFIGGNKILGVLIEGKFQSLYAGRGIPTDSIVPQRPNEAFTPMVAEGAEPRMVIISDGEFAIGETINGQVKPLPADNKTLMLNLIDFLSGQEIITKIRVREINRRMLDRSQYKGSERFYQIVNIALPVLLILLFGFVRDYLRRRRNQSYQNRQS